MRGIVDLPKPVIAAVEGVATAAGCQLVAACDLAIAGEGARFALPGVNIGLFCSTPLVAVGRAVSRKAAMEMALTGEPIDAAARRSDRPRQSRRRRRARRSPKRRRSRPRSPRAPAATIAIGKRTFQRQIETSLADAYRIASDAMVENLGHPDADEGIAAFLEKRAPEWSER